MRRWLPQLIYGGVTLLVLLPMLTPGFILTLDLVFTPELPIPQNVTSSYPFHALLHALNLVIPADIIEKIILFCALLLGGLGMHRLVQSIAGREPLAVWAIYAAGIFYVINPFTYSRLMAGQYAVLLGYALLPWLVRAAWKLTRKPTWNRAMQLGILTTLIGIVSIHSLVAVAVLTMVGAAIGLFRKRPAWKFVSVALATFLLLSSFWLAPLLLGEGKTAGTINSFSSADNAAFATVGESPLERMFHVLRLQGFWAEAKNLYLLPQDRMAGWGLIMFVIIGLVIAGGVYLWRRQRLLVLWFGVSALVGTLLAIGANTWLVDVPLLSGLREPHKLVMLLALCYAIFLAFGAHATLQRLQKKSESLYAAGVVGVLILPFLGALVMLWGANNQLQPRQYPDDWFVVKKQIEQDNGSGKILFLPWHQYMTFDFAGRIIASPAPNFFGKRVIVSQDPELDGATSGSMPESQKTITQLLEAPSQIAERLAKEDIRYIVLAKDLDYEKYTFLQQAEFELVADYPSIAIYQNTAWREQ